MNKTAILLSLLAVLILPAVAAHARQSEALATEATRTTAPLPKLPSNIQLLKRQQTHTFVTETGDIIIPAEPQPVLNDDVTRAQAAQAPVNAMNDYWQNTQRQRMQSQRNVRNPR